MKKPEPEREKEIDKLIENEATISASFNENDDTLTIKATGGEEGKKIKEIIIISPKGEKIYGKETGGQDPYEDTIDLSDDKYPSGEYKIKGITEERKRNRNTNKNRKTIRQTRNANNKTKQTNNKNMVNTSRLTNRHNNRKNKRKQKRRNKIHPNQKRVINNKQRRKNRRL